MGERGGRTGRHVKGGAKLTSKTTCLVKKLGKLRASKCFEPGVSSFIGSKVTFIHISVPDG